MIFKTTLLMSNPQIIRVFELDAEGAVKTIIRAVEAVHDWSVDSGLTIWRNGKVISNTNDVKIRELFQEETKDDVWELRLDSDKLWVFRLEVEDYRENEQKELLPRLCRYRGLNPDYSVGTLRTWNLYARRLANGEAIYHYNKGYVGEDSYRVNPKSVKTKLFRAIRTDLNLVEINYKWTMPLQSLMNYHTINEMKTIIEENDLDIYLYQRKANMAADLAACYDDPDFLVEILGEMSMAEYETFSNCVRKNEKYLDNNDTLVRYGIMLGAGSPYKGYLPAELLSSYENYLLEEGDEDILEGKKAKEVMDCAYILYGVFDFGTLCELAAVMYPELDTEQELEEQWENEFLGLTTVEQNRNGENQGETEVVFDSLNIAEGNAKKYWQIMSKANITPYIPSREEALAIARKGLGFSETAERELRRLIIALHDRYGYYKDDVIIADIYNMCHMNYKINEIVNVLMRRYHLNKTVAKYQDLKKAILKYKGEVRQIMFGGHTGEEAKKLFHLEIREEI